MRYILKQIKCIFLRYISKNFKRIFLHILVNKSHILQQFFIAYKSWPWLLRLSTAPYTIETRERRADAKAVREDIRAALQVTTGRPTTKRVDVTRLLELEVRSARNDCTRWRGRIVRPSRTREESFWSENSGTWREITVPLPLPRRCTGHVLALKSAKVFRVRRFLREKQYAMIMPHWQISRIRFRQWMTTRLNDDASTLDVDAINTFRDGRRMGDRRGKTLSNGWRERSKRSENEWRRFFSSENKII